MLQFILRRLGLVIPTFIGITLLTFAFVHMIPGDPVMIMAGERGISPERHAQLLAELGLDKPMWQQYLHYIWGVMHGDLGISMKKPNSGMGRVRAALSGHAGTWRLRDDFCDRSRDSGWCAGCG
ncbi:dipeptide transporter permease DppB [Escherichia coli]|uniref:Dipeptide transporter permease DppB n=1 Tax=Escherichia coli TaxID=562 RepID=A0A376VV87_ECOLX|nr:dipeptide transporter permease DppB [Escherichia coli]